MTAPRLTVRARGTRCMGGATTAAAGKRSTRARTARASAAPPAAATTRSTRRTPASRSDCRTRSGEPARSSTNTSTAPSENTLAPAACDHPRGGAAACRRLWENAAATVAAPSIPMTHRRPDRCGPSFGLAGGEAVPSPADAGEPRLLVCRSRRAANTRATPALTTTAPPPPRTAGGAVEAAAATLLTHHRSSAVGRWISQASQPPPRPAATPPVRPHIITGAAAGPAIRLAGNDASGTRPNTATSSGITAS